MDAGIPKLRRSDESAKITIYLDPEAVAIYKAGKSNGWNTPRIAREAVQEALREKAKALTRKAE